MNVQRSTTGFRLSNAERFLLHAICKQEGRHPGEMIRELIRAEARRRGLRPTDGTLEAPRKEARHDAN